MATGPQHPMVGVDSYAPAEIAQLVRTRGVAKARAPADTTLVLGIVAGAFIALGGVLATLIATDSELGLGPTRWLAGIGFSLGLILVVVAGAELFTGNVLIVMAWVSRQVSLGGLLRNWALVYAGNLLGAWSVVGMVYLAEWWRVGEGAVGQAALATAAAKAALPFGVAFVRGILANALVCLAVWLATAGRSVVDKVFAIIFPISAFVANAFEHSIANAYLVPIGLLLRGRVPAEGIPAEQLASLDLGGFLGNLAAATLGNIVGGGVLVALVYWFVYLRPERSS
jgi:formate/nitrite transporter